MIMSAIPLSPTRRSFLAASAAAGAFSLHPVHLAAAAEDNAKGRMIMSAIAAADNAIRPFRIDAPEAELTELRRRISATKWPERETVTDATQGVQLATTRELARHRATDYDWSKC